MPVCALCESQGFDTIDGLFYCQNCGTQSQDVRVETTDFDAVATSNVPKRKERKRHLKYARVKGKPWFTYEAFQWIMKLQVQFLINLGVDPELKDVIFQLWYRYLQKSGIAFTGCPQGLLPKPKTVSFERDSKMLGLTTGSSGQKRKAEKMHDIKSDDDDGLELCSHFSSEEFYEEDDPMKALDKSESDREQDKKLGNEQELSAGGNANVTKREASTDDSMTDSSDNEDSLGSLDVNVDKARRTQQVENGHITPPTTLAFCYLGLLWLDEPVFIGDLIRWVKEGELPYFQASRLLPNHMKFSGADSSHLCPVVVPTAGRVCLLAGRIARMLQLPDFPEQKFSRYTARFIVDLHLPACLHGIVRKLIDKARPKTCLRPSKAHKNQPVIQQFEVDAMAFIVVSLKLLYGIDNVTEREQERLAVPTDQNTYSPYEVVPLFTDWLNGYKKCEAARLKRGVPWTEEQVKLVRDSATYSAFCRSDIFGSWAIPDLVNNETRFVNRPYYRCRNEESQENYAQLFKSLMTAKQGEEFGSVKPAATGFPTSCYHGTEISGSGCFDKMHLRGVPMQKLRDSDSKYVYYPLSRNRTLYHESYRELLNILADHIQVPSHELQDRIRYLEDRLLVDQPRWSRYVRIEEEEQ